MKAHSLVPPLLACAGVILFAACRVDDTPTASVVRTPPPPVPRSIANGAPLAARTAAVPASVRWVGPEHNRLVALAVREFATTRHGVPAGAALRAAGCRNVGALMRREAAAFARHAGAEPTRITFRALESVTKNWTDCYGFVADARSAMAAGSRLSLFTGFRGGAADESIGLSETAIALMDEAAARIDAAGSDAEIAKVWQMTLAGTAGLNELDAATVSAFVDVGQSSYDYWNGLSGGAGPNGAINATGQMSLYPTEPTVRMGLAADLAGCYGVVRFTRFLIGITGPQASVGLCAGGAAVASGAYLYQAINQT